MHMRITFDVDDVLLKRAEQLTGVREKSALIRLGLKTLIAREGARRLAWLGGTERRLRPAPRGRANSPPAPRAALPDPPPPATGTGAAPRLPRRS